MALSKYTYPWVADTRFVDAAGVVAEFRREYAEKLKREAKTREFQRALVQPLIGKKYKLLVEIAFDTGAAYSEPWERAIGDICWVRGMTDYGNIEVQYGEPDDAEREKYPPLASLTFEEFANDLEPIE